MNIRDRRHRLKLSQTRLAGLAKVSRFKICLHERGDQSLKPEEVARIQRVFEEEAQRIRRDLMDLVGTRLPGSIRRTATRTQSKLNRRLEA